MEASRRGIIVTTRNVLRPEMLCTSYSCFLFRRSSLMNWSGMNTAIVSKWKIQTHRKKEKLLQSWADAKLIHILSKEENLLNFEYFLTVADFVHNQVCKEGDGFQETYSTCLTKLRHKPPLQLHSKLHWEEFQMRWKLTVKTAINKPTTASFFGFLNV